MKNAVKLLISTVATIGMASAAFAGTFSPTGSPAATTATGSVEVRKLLTLNCNLEAPISSNGTITTSTGTTGTSVDYISLTGGDANCDNVAFTSANMPVTYVDADTVEIHGITVVGITGNCAGSLRADLSGGTLTFSHSNTIPATSGLGNCSVSGTAATSPSASYTTP